MPRWILAILIFTLFSIGCAVLLVPFVNNIVVTLFLGVISSIIATFLFMVAEEWKKAISSHHSDECTGSSNSWLLLIANFLWGKEICENFFEPIVADLRDELGVIHHSFRSKPILFYIWQLCYLIIAYAVALISTTLYAIFLSVVKKLYQKLSTWRAKR